MNSRPILFSAPMVRALLAGTKTQTRRIVKPQPISTKFRKSDAVDDGREYWVDYTSPRPMPSNGTGDNYTMPSLPVRIFCPYGQPGDRLWVRETWGYTRQCDDMGDGDVIAYAAGGEHVYEDVDGKRRLRLTQSGSVMRPNHFCYPPKPWTTSIHMPRWASRITLEITSPGIRVERLNDISEEDARAEGISDGGCLKCGKSEPCGCPEPCPCARDSFINLWQTINGPSSWSANPWVWVVEFKRVMA